MSSSEFPTNPFTSHRWETEVQHRIWVPPEASVVASPKACLISGLRGTGKTALLNCLDPLAPSRDGFKFLNPLSLPTTCIGVYINILTEFTHFLPLLAGDALAASEDQEVGGSRIHAQAFRTYLVFMSLSRTLEVIDDCQRRNILEYTAMDEADFVQSFRRLWTAHIIHNTQERPLRSILECASALSKVCMAIRINSLRLYPDRVTDLIGGAQPIVFYRDFCKILSTTNILRGKAGPYHVKISLDDVHRFRRTDQALLNGLIEVNTAPVTWNLSFVSGRYDPSLSPDPESPLTQHDVERVDLNYENNHRGFRRLCQKLYNMRLGFAESYDDEDSEYGGYSKVLSNPNVSVLFSLLVKDTTRSDFRAALFDNLDFVAERLSEFEKTRRSPHHDRAPDKRKYLYQTYVFVNLFGADRDRFSAFLKARSPAQIDNYFRQKNVAALVCAANEMGRQTPYAGTNALVSLSDGCVRDFLRILAILYDNASSGLHGKARRGKVTNFFSPNEDRYIPLEEQSRSFVQASQAYLEQQDESTDRSGRILSSLLNSLAELTRLLQSRDKLRALALPERGMVQLNFTEATLLGDLSHRIELIRRALALGQYTGSIRLARGVFWDSAGVPQTDQVVFRLHRLVAPQYRYSARGPQRIVHIPLRFILEFGEDRPVAAREWADRVFGEIYDVQDEGPESEFSQPELFL